MGAFCSITFFCYEPVDFGVRLAVLKFLVLFGLNLLGNQVTKCLFTFLKVVFHHTL